MKQISTLVAFKETLLSGIIKRKMKGRINGFCELQGINKSTISRILNLQNNCSDELFDYLCQFCEIDLFLEWHKKGYFQI